MTMVLQPSYTIVKWLTVTHSVQGYDAVSVLTVNLIIDCTLVYCTIGLRSYCWLLSILINAGFTRIMTISPKADVHVQAYQLDESQGWCPWDQAEAVFGQTESGVSVQNCACSHCTLLHAYTAPCPALTSMLQCCFNVPPHFMFPQKNLALGSSLLQSYAVHCAWLRGSVLTIFISSQNHRIDMRH